MEADLAGLAVECGTQEEIDAITEAVERMREDVEFGRSCGESEMAFHLGIAEAAPNDP